MHITKTFKNIQKKNTFTGFFTWVHAYKVIMWNPEEGSYNFMKVGSIIYGQIKYLRLCLNFRSDRSTSHMTFWPEDNSNIHSLF